MQGEEETDSRHQVAKEGKIMSITIEDNLEEAIETYARLSFLGHFAKAASLFEDVLKHYLDQLPVFVEYANFLVQQGKYGVLLDRVNERITMQADAKSPEEETVYLELLRALSMLHFEGQLVGTLEMLRRRSSFYPTWIRPPVELTYIQIRSVETYLAIITAVISVMPKKAIEYTHNVTIKLSRERTHVFETGSAAKSESPWAELQVWCVMLAKDHPQEAVNVFRNLLNVLPTQHSTVSWALKFIRNMGSSRRDPYFILAKVESINAWMSFRRRHPLQASLPVPREADKSDETSTVGDPEDAEMGIKAASRLLDELGEIGYDARSQQIIELRINEIASDNRRHILGMRDLADIAREEANYRLESHCLQVMFERGGGRSRFLSAIAPVLEFPGTLYTHFAQDAVELVTFFDRLNTNSLHTTVSIGSFAGVTLLIDRGDDPMMTNQQGHTSMHQAASKGYEAIAQLFLNHDRTLLLCVDENGYLPLHTAAENGHNALLPLFLQSERSHVNTQVLGQPYHEPFQKAASSWKLGTSGTERRQSTGTALHLAAANGHEGVVTALLQYQARADERDEKGWTALHKACARWQYGVANILLRHGVKVNLKTQVGLTAIDLAAKAGHTALVKLLLQHHAEVSSSDGSGSIALSFAAENGDLEIATLLLGHGPDVLAAPNKGVAPLHVAAKNGHLNIVRLFLENSADLEAKDNRGTALHFAARNGHSDVVELLLEHGADLEAKDDVGRTVLYVAVQRGNQKLARLLLDNGADIGAKATQELWPALHLVAREGSIDMLKLLLEYPKVKPVLAQRVRWTSGDVTPLQIAEIYGHEEIAKLLKAAEVLELDVDDDGAL